MATLLIAPKAVSYVKRLKIDNERWSKYAMEKAYDAEFNALSKAQQKAVDHYESGLLLMSGMKYYLVGKDREGKEQELGEKGLIVIPVDNEVVPKEIDLVQLQRKYETSFIRSTLNNALRKLIMDRKAVILRDKETGLYFMYADRENLKLYILKYGEECSDCPKRAKENAKKQSEK